MRYNGQMDTSIFKAYDIRGEYPNEFNEETAQHIARAVALFLHAKKILIAMDNRTSSPSLKEAVIKGLSEEGVDIVDAGITTTPMFYFAVNKEKTDGGIMITASHNPPKYNGLKITRQEARPVGEGSGLLEIKKIALEGAFATKRSDGAFIRADVLSAYVDFLTRGVMFPKIHIVVDAACGTSGTIIEKMTRNTDTSILPLCFSPCKQQAHEGNPMKDENVQDLRDAVKKSKADLGVAFDGDGDRVFFFDNKGGRIPTYAIASLLARRFLATFPGSSIITDVRMPLGFSDAISRYGGTCVVSKVGHVFMKEEIRKANAVFGAEVSGHFYFRDFFYADSGMYTLMRVLDTLSREQKSLAELTQPFLTRFQSGELNFWVKDKTKAIAALGATFADGVHITIDGLTVRYPDWWFNARPSNTELLLRVNIEAEEKKKLEKAKGTIEKILSGF